LIINNNKKESIVSNTRVTLSVDKSGIAEVKLNRPDKLNALDMDMFKAINKTISKIKKDKNIRVVIVSGEGADFCSGLDVKAVMKSPSAAMKLLFKWLPGNANLAQKVTARWRKLPVPVIMAIHGRCWGGGMQIALGGDFRIVHPQSSLSIMESRWGLIPDMAGNTALTRLMPIDQAMKLAMTAETFSAQQGQEYNLVTEVHEHPIKAAKELANQLIKRSPDVLAALKKLYQNNWTGSERDMLAKESLYQIKILSGKNQRIAVSKEQGKDKSYKPAKNW
jgi:enoyl-CoA hydratase/carnithine racemase